MQVTPKIQRYFEIVGKIDRAYEEALFERTRELLDNIYLASGGVKDDDRYEIGVMGTFIVVEEDGVQDDVLIDLMSELKAIPHVGVFLDGQKEFDGNTHQLI